MWLGKFIFGVAGLLSGSVIMLVLGLFVGHLLDRAFSPVFPGKLGERQEIIFRLTFAFLGRMAKADGRISEAEIAHVEALMSRMRLDKEARDHAIAAFISGKASDFDLAENLKLFRRAASPYDTLNLMMAEMLVQMTMIDGELADAERNLLEHIATGLGISRWQLQLMLSRYRGGAYDYFSSSKAEPSSQDALQAAYTTLGVDANATMADIKQAYRRLMSKHHPDKLTGSGATEQMLNLAKERAQSIQHAYDLIKNRHSGSL